VRCLFATDLHGIVGRYRKLLVAIRDERPRVVLLGGDLLPHRAHGPDGEDFIRSLGIELGLLRRELTPSYPRVLLILGNDDAGAYESTVIAGQEQGLWEYVHMRRNEIDDHDFYGYACVPPTPFTLKDWERYDVSRFVDPGCVSPEDGFLSAPLDPDVPRNGTIAADLARLVGDDDLTQAVFLFHCPPYGTCLDRAALDGKLVDHVPVDVHVGSIAIRRLIDERQPLLTLHGHVHESTRLTSAWRDRIGRTHCFQGAHDGPELALVHFDTDRLEDARRELL